MYEDEDFRNAGYFEDDEYRNASPPYGMPPWMAQRRVAARRPAYPTRAVPVLPPPPAAPPPAPVMPVPYPQQWGVGQTPCTGGAFPRWSTARTLKTVGVVADLAGQAIAAILPVPTPPNIVGDEKTDTENMKRYHDAVAHHAKTDERIRTVAKAIRETLDLFRAH
jgi:hypothetical protein